MISLLGGDKRNVKIAFWVIAPLLFSVMLYFYGIIFGYVYGLILVAIIGEDYSGLVATIVFITSFVFSITHGCEFI